MKTIQIIIILLFSNLVFISAQQNVVDSFVVEEDEPTFVQVEEPATFRGGDLTLFRDYVQQSIVWPAGYEGSGRIIVQFCINKYGKVVDIKVLKGINPLPDNEVIRVILESNKLNAWKPAKQGGKTVKQSFVIPIAFNR
jgi:protein TonB